MAAVGLASQSMNPSVETRRCKVDWRGLLLVIVMIAGTRLCASEETTVVKWDFGDPADAAQWRANAHLAGVRVEAGALHCRGAGSDPILELVAPLEFPAAPWQFLELRLRASGDGTAEWFWSNTTEGKFGGFTQDKTTRFAVRGDGAWHTWRVFPFWHAEGRIIRLRLDLYDGAEFAVAGIRVGALEMPSEMVSADFAFNDTDAGWRSGEGTRWTVTPEGLEIELTAAGGFMLAPPIRFEAEGESVVSIDLAVDAGRQGTLLYATDRTAGWQRHAFPLEAGGEMVTYHLDMLAAPDWHGRIIALGLQPSDEPGAHARLGRFKVSDAPTGPPRLAIKAFAPIDAILRAGRPARLTARVCNLGATPLTNLRATLAVPGEMQVKSGPTADQMPARLGFDEERELEWTVECPEAGEREVRLTVDAENAGSQQRLLSLRFEPALKLPRMDYVPEPQPVRGPIEVGAYYFPGWRSAGQWQPIRGYPERRPALGWYREGEPGSGGLADQMGRRTWHHLFRLRLVLVGGGATTRACAA
jgi:hypothetical protein